MKGLVPPAVASPRNIFARDTQQTQITRGGPPNRATDENDNVSNRRQFNINFTQINLNKQKAATGDLALFIKNKETPFVLVQEPHVNGKNVITKLTRDTRILPLVTPTHVQGLAYTITKR